MFLSWISELDKNKFLFLLTKASMKKYIEMDVAIFEVIYIIGNMSPFYQHL